MIKSTKNYGMFKLIGFNRANGVNEKRVLDLMDSITSRNLLHLRPIEVSDSMEVYQGQHRLEAAKRLGVEIYYEVKEDIKPADILILNDSKPWGLDDVLNYYVHQNFPEYKLFKKFMEENNITCNVALNFFTAGGARVARAFRTGFYKFDEKKAENYVNVVKVQETIKYMTTGRISFLNSAKFLRALGRITSHPDFSMEKFLKNLSMKSGCITVKATFGDYMDLFLKIYNWHNRTPISFNVFEEDHPVKHEEV